MLTGLLLVCSLTTTPDYVRDCTKDNAVQVVRVPGSTMLPLTCFRDAQAYYAETQMGKDLRDDERIKIVCARA